MPKSHYTSYFKAIKLVSKVLSILLNDSSVEIPPIESGSVVKEFLKAFLHDLPEVHLEREIDFGIDIIQDNHPIFIPPYIMAVAQSKELKEKLKDFLDKGFIDQIILEDSSVSMIWNLRENLFGIGKEVDYFPVLTLSESNQGFVVYCDASRICIGFVLIHLEG